MNPDREELVCFDAGQDWDAAAHVRLLRQNGGASSGYTADLIERLHAALRSLASSDSGVKGEPEPVAWRDIVKQPDERPLPTYGQIPWAQLGRDVNDATFGRRANFEFSDKVYPGHQMVLGINFTSLARIVDKYRYYGLPCEANPTVAPPADAGMREAFVRVLASLAAAISILERTPKAKKAVASDKMFDTMLDDYRKALEAGRAALTAPGATFSKRQMLECILLSLNVDGVYLNSLTVGELRRAL